MLSRTAPRPSEVAARSEEGASGKLGTVAGHVVDFEPLEGEMAGGEGMDFDLFRGEMIGVDSEPFKGEVTGVDSEPFKGEATGGVDSKLSIGKVDFKGEATGVDSELFKGEATGVDSELFKRGVDSELSKGGVDSELFKGEAKGVDFELFKGGVDSKSVPGERSVFKLFVREAKRETATSTGLLTGVSSQSWLVESHATGEAWLCVA